MDLAMLCRILVVEENACRMEPKQFLSLLLHTRLHVQEKDTCDVTRPAVRQGWREDVDTGEMRLARSIGRLLGAGNPCVDAYIPLAQIRDVCRRAFGDKLDVDAAIDGLLTEIRDKPKLPDWLLVTEEEAEKLEEKESYAVQDMAALMDWEPGLSIRPPLHKKLAGIIRQMHGWGEVLYEEYAAEPRSARAAQLAQRTADLPRCPAAVWKWLCQNLDDRATMERYLCLFSIDIDDEDIHIFVTAMLWQPELFHELWEEV